MLLPFTKQSFYLSPIKTWHLVHTLLSTISIFILLICSNIVYCQFGKGSDWHKYKMSDKDKVKFSRIEKCIGLSMVGTGIYLANAKKNPQSIDVPFIIIGSIITIEGIRLRKTVRNRFYS